MFSVLVASSVLLADWFVFCRGFSDFGEDSQSGRELRAHYGERLLDEYMKILSNPSCMAVKATCCLHGHAAGQELCAHAIGLHLHCKRKHNCRQQLQLFSSLCFLMLHAWFCCQCCRNA